MDGLAREAEEVQYHIQCKKGDVGKYVFLPGDPGRCELIAREFDQYWEVAYIFVLPSIKKLRAGCICLVVANQERARIEGKWEIKEDLTDLIKVAVEGVRVLIKMDVG